MNIIEELDLAFKETEMDDFTKIRYIYLYVCKKFSYDIRFLFALPKLKKEIYDKKVDIENVQDFEIVCYTFAKVIRDILEHYGYQCKLIKEDNRSDTPHAYVIVKLGQRVLRLDPVTKHDSSRVKINIPTYDFAPMVDDPTFSDDLEDADELMKKINFYKSDKESMKFNNWLSSLTSYGIGPDPEIRYLNVFNAIVSTFNLNKSLKRYDDVDYFLSYALRKSKINDYRTIVRSATFFNNDDPTMSDLITLIIFEYNHNRPLFYILEPYDDGFHIRQIDSEEMLDKLSHYSNYITDEYFKNAAKKGDHKIL